MIKRIQSPTFAVCVNNTGYRATLKTGKLYQVVPDSDAEKHGLIRVIDESGEDYGYAAERFLGIPVPDRLKRALKAISTDQPIHRNSSPVRKARARPPAKK
jgi:hypothetical protein